MKNFTGSINWIASYPKSGNTWIRMFINAYLSNQPLDGSQHYVLKDTNPSILQLLSPVAINALTEVERFIYRPAMLLNMLKFSSGKRLFLKTHNAKVVAENISVIPSCISDDSIYVIRDPRDICISLSHHLDQTIDETIAFMGNENQCLVYKDSGVTDLILSWSKHVESWTNKNKDVLCTVIKYEELFTLPEIYFETLVKALRLPFDKNRLNFSIQQASFGNLRKLEENGKFNEKGRRGDFFRVGKVGQWKDILSVEQANKIKVDHGPLMEFFGYV